jgi:hypothetical protein
MYRLTRPGKYPSMSPGATDPSARQGYYVKATSPADARGRLWTRWLEDPLVTGERLDVQCWDDGPTHGMLVDDAGRPVSRRFVQ